MQSKSTASRTQFRAALVSPLHRLVVTWTDVVAATREAAESLISPGLRQAAAFDGLEVMALEHGWTTRPARQPLAEAGGPRAFRVGVADANLAHWGIHEGDAVWIDPDRNKGARDLVLFRVLGADGHERDMYLCDLDGVDDLLGVLAPGDVLDAVGPVTWVVPARGFKPKRRRRARRAETPESSADWTASLSPIVRQQLDELLGGENA